MEQAAMGVIGGSGLYALASQQGMREVVVDTPWGAPSGPFMLGDVDGRRVAFLARHAAGHRLLPSEINYRANIWGMKLLGVQRLISASAVGSLREELEPRHFVVVDQFIDRTHGRPSTFFGDGMVAHVSLADPTCSEMQALASPAVEEAGAVVHVRGTYVCMQGPQFSTRAESNLYRSWGADVIGMTNLTEARLAREAEICYCPLAMVTDYDCWRDEGDDVSVEALLAVLHDNALTATQAVAHLVASLPEKRSCTCGDALSTALVTRAADVPPETLSRLQPLIGRYVGRSS